MEHEHAEAVRDIHRPGSAFQSFGAHAWMKHFIDRTFGVGTMKNDNQIVPQSHEEVYRKVLWHLMKVYGFDFWRAHFARFGKTDEDWKEHASPKEAPPSWTYQALFNCCCNATTCVANDGNPSAPFSARRCCDEKAPGSTAKVNMCRVPKDAPLWPAAADATAAAATAAAAAATADPTATAASSPRNASATTAKARSYSGGCSARSACSGPAVVPQKPLFAQRDGADPAPPPASLVLVSYLLAFASVVGFGGGALFRGRLPPEGLGHPRLHRPGRRQPPRDTLGAPPEDLRQRLLLRPPQRRARRYVLSNSPTVTVHACILLLFGLFDAFLPSPMA